MQAFDRNLTISLTRALEQDDIKTQAGRINGMMTAVSLFVQKIQTAKETMHTRSTLEKELRHLKMLKEKSQEQEDRMSEINKDLDEVRKLEIQYKKSKDEVRSLVNSTEDLVRQLRKI